MAGNPLIIFDFDGTLTRDDTFITFALHALNPLRVAGAVIRSSISLLKWKAGLLSSGKAKERLYRSLYKGLKKTDIEDSAKTFSPRYNHPILEALTEHRDRGDEVWIISASLDLWLKPIARQLGVGLICTGSETDPQGRLTGRFSTPNCHGSEKVRRLAMTVPDFGSRPITLYADEITRGGDTALAEIATTIIAVK